MNRIINRTMGADMNITVLLGACSLLGGGSSYLYKDFEYIFE